MKNGPWICAGVQARIEPPCIPLVKLEVEDECDTHCIKVNMRRNTSSEGPKTYNINMNTFDYGQPEDFLAILNNFKISIDGTGTTTPSGWIYYLSKIIFGQALRGSDEIQSQNGGSTNYYLKLITYCLLEYFFPVN